MPAPPRGLLGPPRSITLASLISMRPSYHRPINTLQFMTWFITAPICGSLLIKGPKRTQEELIGVLDTPLLYSNEPLPPASSANQSSRHLKSRVSCMPPPFGAHTSRAHVSRLWYVCSANHLTVANGLAELFTIAALRLRAKILELDVF